MHDAFFKGARSSMTVQALAIAVRRIEVNRQLHLAQILHVDMAKSAHLREGGAIEDVVRVTGVARLVAGNPAKVIRDLRNISRTD